VAGTTDGGGIITVTLSCPEGQSAQADSNLMRLTPDGDSLTLSFVGGDESDQTLRRCP
jgi:hypothetical protein